MSDNFKTCFEAVEYCKKWGLKVYVKNSKKPNCFEIAEALLCAYKGDAPKKCSGCGRPLFAYCSVCDGKVRRCLGR